MSRNELAQAYKAYSIPVRNMNFHIAKLEEAKQQGIANAPRMVDVKQREEGGENNGSTKDTKVNRIERTKKK